MTNRPKQTGKNHFLLLTILLLAILAAVSWPSTVGICCREIAALREKKEKLTGEVAFLNDICTCEDNDPEIFKALLAENDHLRQLIPAAQDLPESLADIEGLLNRRAIIVHSMQIGPLDCPADHCTVKIDLQLSGSKTEILQLLEESESFHRFIIFDDLIWSAGEGIQSSLDLSCRLVFAGSKQEPLEKPDTTYSGGSKNDGAGI